MIFDLLFGLIFIVYFVAVFSICGIVLMIKQHFGVEEQQKVAPKPKCSVCGTTENVKYMGGYQPYLCDSEDCIPF